MDRAILTSPGRVPIHHAGFELVLNDSPYAHPWHRCAHGHYKILTQKTGSIIILEDDVLLSPRFEETIEACEDGNNAHRPFVASFCVGVRYPVFPVDRRLFEFPPECQDWGTQAIYYSALARPLVGDLMGAYLRCPISPDPAIRGAKLGVDCFLFPALRSLGVPIYHHAAVQHMCAPSSCLSPTFWSPYFPPPDKLVKGKNGWH